MKTPSTRPHDAVVSAQHSNAIDAVPGQQAAVGLFPQAASFAMLDGLDMTEVPLLPAAFLAIGFPLVILVVTELLNSGRRRGWRPTPTLGVLRNIVLPALVAMLFVTEIWQLPAEDIVARVIRTAFWVSALYALLTLANDSLFGGSTSAGLRERVPKLFRDLMRVLMVAIGGALIYSHVWQQPIGGALTALGLGSVVIGLALQEPLGNIVSGLMLLLERPLAIGDWIVADGTTGKVIEINWRSVHIETILHEMRIIPNVALYKTSFSNLSRPTSDRTDTYDVGFSYDHPPSEVKEALLGLLSTTPGVLRAPPPEVHTLNYGDFSITYRMYFSVARHEEILPVRDAILTRVWYVARRHHLQIPFPIQMEYRPYESPSPREPGVAELLERFPRYQKVREAMLAAADRGAALAIKAGTPLPPAKANVVAYAKGEEMLARGASGHGFALVVDGVADLLAVDATGMEVRIAELAAGDFYGEATGSASYPSDFCAVARTDVRVVVIEAGTMAEWLQGSSGLAAEIGDAIESRRLAALRLRQHGKVTVPAARPG